MEVLDGGKGWSTRRGEDAAGNMMNVVLMHKYDLKKVLAADLEQLILEGQRALDEYWLIELHRLSLERKSLVARHEVIFVQEMSMLHFDISSLRLLPKLSEGSKMYPEQVALMSSVGNGAVLLALYRRIIRPFTPAHTREKLAVHGNKLYELHTSIGLLSNLETLDLEGLRFGSLLLDRLPRLRVLRLTRCAVQKLGVKRAPLLNELNAAQCAGAFCGVRGVDSSAPERLRSLRRLRAPSDAFAAAFARAGTALKSLTLEDAMVSHENDDDDAARATLGGVLRARAATRAAYLGNEAPHLDGLVSLELLRARDFTAKHFAALPLACPALRRLRLVACANCRGTLASDTQLPPPVASRLRPCLRRCPKAARVKAPARREPRPCQPSPCRRARSRASLTVRGAAIWGR